MARVVAFAAIQARVRVRYSELLRAEDLMHLSEAQDYPALLAQLKQSVYEPYLNQVKESSLTPRRLAYQLRLKLVDAFELILNQSPQYTHELIQHFMRRFEVDNLKGILRGIISGSEWDTVRYVLFPLRTTVIPGEAMFEAGNINAAIELLQGTPYYETLSFAIKRYNTERSLFPLEVALDLVYVRRMWELIQALPGEDRQHAVRVVGTLMDTYNLMWAIRYRVYYNLSEEEIINYTLPIGYQVKDADIRAIAAGADIGMVVSRLYPDLRDVNSMLQNPVDGLPLLETALFGIVSEHAHREFSGSPFHIGLPLAYFVLLEREIQNLTVLIEAKSTGSLPAEYSPLLIYRPESL